MQVRIENDVAAARALLEQGWCPVEASYGDESVVDELGLDHHGALASDEAVAVRAWHELHAARRDDPRFVVAGELDPDAAFAIAALAGVVPGPDSDHAALVGDIVDVIGILDTDPVGRDLTDRPGFAYVRLWSLLARTRDSRLASAGALTWQQLLARDERALRPLLNAAVDSERERRATASRDAAERLVYESDDGRVAVIADPTHWGFDVWYDRDPDHARDDPHAWGRWIVVTHASHGDDGAGTATVGCPNTAVAEQLLGPGGLLNVFPHLTPPGWGGREAIGGSPRNQPVTLAETVTAARYLAEAIS